MGVLAVHLKKIVVLHVDAINLKNIKKQSIHLDVTLKNAMTTIIGNVKSV